MNINDVLDPILQIAQSYTDKKQKKWQTGKASSG